MTLRQDALLWAAMTADIEKRKSLRSEVASPIEVAAHRVLDVKGYTRAHQYPTLTETSGEGATFFVTNSIDYDDNFHVTISWDALDAAVTE